MAAGGRNHYGPRQEERNNARLPIQPRSHVVDGPLRDLVEPAVADRPHRDAAWHETSDASAPASAGRGPRLRRSSTCRAWACAWRGQRAAPAPAASRASRIFALFEALPCSKLCPVHRIDHNDVALPPLHRRHIIAFASASHRCHGRFCSQGRFPQLGGRTGGKSRRHKIVSDATEQRSCRSSFTGRRTQQK